MRPASRREPIRSMLLYHRLTPCQRFFSESGLFCTVAHFYGQSKKAKILIWGNLAREKHIPVFQEAAVGSRMHMEPEGIPL